MFNKKEDKGIILIILIIASVILIKNYNNISFFSNKKYNSPLNLKHTKLETITLKSFLEDSTKKTGKNIYNHKAKYTDKQKNIATNKQNIPIKYFSFDPNKISKDSILQLGIPSKVAYNWTKYLQKGGHFYSKKQLLKIYGFKKNDYKKIEKYIVINEDKRKETEITYSSKNKKSTKTINKPQPHVDKQKNIRIDINTCKAEDLIVLRGIGEVLSKRIIKFRDKLGGYVSVNQLKEVYGLPENTFENIKENIFINGKSIKKIKINIANKSHLKSFPYISYRLASQIINFRNQHGFFKSENDLLEIKSIDSLKLKKIEPYLDYATN